MRDTRGRRISKRRVLLGGLLGRHCGRGSVNRELKFEMKCKAKQGKKGHFLVVPAFKHSWKLTHVPP